ncbi:NADP-dependent oxidoreductase [Nonomuraea sp. SBT364]|uniref:NADP-dependent oxidoreductase n=1 Tax=Nonomuraea sp. SBT364 TaxID=1580530 RepID=UPI000AF72D31|nr:NADP-dependent oxidoreductase [Nonomuraea sp. SBT364]
MSRTMRAARVHAYGGADVIRYDEIPVPSPGPGEVLVRAAATSFNPSEVGLRAGYLHDKLDISLPHTLGWDVAGTVAALGAGVTALEVGDAVIGLIPGAAAEYVLAPANLLTGAPRSIPLAHAAAIPVAGLTAWQAVFEQARIERGRRVLVNGAGGGVGLFAVQLAKRAGATVVATASPRSAEAVRRLGADEVVDYTTTPLPGGMDVVLNLAAVPPGAAAALAPLGRTVITIATPIDAPNARHFVGRADPGQLTEIAGLIDKGELVVEIAETHPLTGLTDLHRRAEAGQTRGKILITLEN